jgi:hypothetical protein
MYVLMHGMLIGVCMYSCVQTYVRVTACRRMYVLVLVGVCMYWCLQASSCIGACVRKHVLGM